MLAYVFVPRKCQPLPPLDLIALARNIPSGQECLFVKRHCTLVFETGSTGAVPATPAGSHTSALFLPRIVSSTGTQRYVTQKGGGLPLERTAPKQLILEGGGASTIDHTKAYRDVFVLNPSTAACIFDVIGDGGHDGKDSA